jgi:hypothetical protein
VRRFRILSIDGGGIRGIVPAIVLERLNKNLPGWLDGVSLVAGTSTGGLFALALARGLEPREIRKFYEEKGPRIFGDSWIDDFRDMGRVLGAQYDSTALVRELKTIFGTTTRGRLDKRVLVTSFDLDGHSDDPGKRIVYANNPSMCALAQTQDARSVKPTPRMKNVVLLSLGTGTSLKFIRGKSLDWGYLKWAGPIIDIMMEGVSGIADYQCGKILGKNYHRLAPLFGPGQVIPMDAHRRLSRLVTFAESVDLRRTVRWLRERWVG